MEGGTFQFSYSQLTVLPNEVLFFSQRKGNVIDADLPGETHWPESHSMSTWGEKYPTVAKIDSKNNEHKKY